VPPARGGDGLRDARAPRARRAAGLRHRDDGRSALLASVRFDAGPRVGRYRVRLAALDTVAVPALAARPGVRLVVVENRDALPAKIAGMLGF